MSADAADRTEWRVGLGTDVHRLQVGRKLVVAGVELPGVMGADAHSDGDVAMHALTDAVLGAAGLPDIGELFPDTEPRWKGAAGRTLLGEAVRRAREAGFSLVNADVVVHLQFNKVAPFKDAMRRALAEALGVTADRVNLKAKTAERMGPVGEGRAVEAVAVVLLAKRSTTAE